MGKSSEFFPQENKTPVTEKPNIWDESMPGIPPVWWIVIYPHYPHPLLRLLFLNYTYNYWDTFQTLDTDNEFFDS